MTAILICLLTKHFFADFVWQTQWMVANKHDPLHPALYAHVAVHAIGTALVVGYFGAPLWLAFADAWIHFWVDLVKARYTATRLPNQRRFWIALGFDQYLHGLTYVFVAACATGAK